MAAKVSLPGGAAVSLPALPAPPGGRGDGVLLVVGGLFLGWLIITGRFAAVADAISATGGASGGLSRPSTRPLTPGGGVPSLPPVGGVPGAGGGAGAPLPAAGPQAVTIRSCVPGRPGTVVMVTRTDCYWVLFKGALAAGCSPSVAASLAAGHCMGLFP